jgi:hypothetical protein
MSRTSIYNIHEALFITSAEDLFNAKTQLDISANIVEMVFYEHIEKPFTHGSIVVLDDFGLRQGTSRINGTEKIKIKINFPSANDEQNIVIDRTYYVTKIENSSQTNERGELLSLTLVDEHFYKDTFKRFSKSYRGDIEDIISRIAIDELGKEVFTKGSVKSAQGIRKVLIPYWTPIHALTWLIRRASTSTGLPLFLYSALFNFTSNKNEGDNNSPLVMASMENSLKTVAKNKNRPLIYSNAAAGSANDNERIFQIISKNEVDVENTMRAVEMGGYGSSYSLTDLGTGRTAVSHVSIGDVLRELRRNELIDDNTSKHLYDQFLEIDNRGADLYDSFRVHQITSSKTYNQFSNYHDDILDDRETPLKMKTHVLKTIFNRNVMDIVIDGAFVFNFEVSVSDKISMIFLNNKSPDSRNDVGELGFIDEYRSGNFAVTAIKHVFTPDTHQATLRVMKLQNINKNDINIVADIL